MLSERAELASYLRRDFGAGFSQLADTVLFEEDFGCSGALPRGTASVQQTFHRRRKQPNGRFGF